MVASDRYSLPSLCVRCFAVVERLDPFMLVKDRDIPLYRGLSVVWGSGEGREAEELLHSHALQSSRGA